MQLHAHPATRVLLQACLGHIVCNYNIMAPHKSKVKAILVPSSGCCTLTTASMASTMGDASQLYSYGSEYVCAAISRLLNQREVYYSPYQGEMLAEVYMWAIKAVCCYPCAWCAMHCVGD